MGLTKVRVDAVAGAGALSDQGRHASGCDGDAYAGGVCDTPAGTVAAAQGSLPLRDALHGNGFALPAVKAKDSVGLGNRLPPLQIGQGAERAPICSGDKTAVVIGMLRCER